MFNLQDVNCSKDEYLILHDGGGGWDSIATQVLKKYQNDNIYYIIIYFSDPKSCDDDPTGQCVSITDKLVYNKVSKFMKLKYGVKDNGDKYLISFEVLN